MICESTLLIRGAIERRSKTTLNMIIRARLPKKGKEIFGCSTLKRIIQTHLFNRKKKEVLLSITDH